MKKLTEDEKAVIQRLGDKLYTVDFVESWIDRPSENVFTNAIEALQQMAVEGFMAAVKRLVAIEPTNRTYIVTEWCPNCESEVEIHGWDTERDGYEAFCPYCGKRLMLCDECQHSENARGCDYDSQIDTCRKRKENMK